MKLLIASDIHGASTWCRRLMDAIDQHQPDRVLLLGDLLYHGPRNDLPADYVPKEVIVMLNSIAHFVVAVRGNCDAEVDQMVLDFPCLADSAVLLDADAPGSYPHTLGDHASSSRAPDDHVPQLHELFLTHGHVYGAGRDNSIDHLPVLPTATTCVFGHTHIKVNEESMRHPGVWLFNPGSVGIPKDGTHSYGLYEHGQFSHVVLKTDS